MAIQHLILSTVLVVTSNWFFFPGNWYDGLKPIEPVYSFPNPEFNNTVPDISLSSRRFYTIEVRQDVSYGDSAGDMELAASQAHPKGIDVHGLPAPAIDNNTSIPKVEKRTFFTRVRAVLFTPLINLSTILLDALKRFWQVSSLILFNLFAISLPQFNAWLKRSVLAMHLAPGALLDKVLQFLQRKLCGALFSFLKRRLPGSLLSFLKRQLPGSLVPFLKDNFMSKEDPSHTQNDQLALTNDPSLPIKDDQERMLFFISTLSSLAAELRGIQTNSTNNTAKELIALQQQLAETQAPIQTTSTALCQTIRRYSTDNANSKSAFEEQCARLEEDDVPGHMAALLAYVQSEFAHITRKGTGTEET